jgi:hypothetical protein
LRHTEGGIQNLDAFAFQLLGYTSEQRVIVFVLDSSKKFCPSQIGPKILQEFDFANSSGHHRFRNAGTKKCPDHFPQLPHIDPRNVFQKVVYFLDGLASMRNRD